MAISDAAIFRILRILEDKPELTQREIAREMAVSLGKTNYCLRALLGRGLVKAQNFRNSSNKRAYMYFVTPEGVAAKAELAKHFLARKRVEYDELRIELDRLSQEVRAQS